MFEKECLHCDEYDTGRRDNPCSVHFMIEDIIEPIVKEEEFDWHKELEAINK